MNTTLQELCRLCGEERVCSFDVFMKIEDGLLMSEVIKNLLNILISESDTIPQQICSLCHTYLLNFLQFRHTAEKTQLFLIELASNLEKEKTVSQTERKHSTESIKSEQSTNFNDALDVISFNSDDETFPLYKKNSSKKRKSSSPNNAHYKDDTHRQSLSWDEDENIPLIKVAQQSSFSGKKRKTKSWKCSKDDDFPIPPTDVGDVSQESTNESALNKPEECNICQRQFSKERYLRHHLRITHKVFINASYQCNRCTRKFMQKLSWQRHQKLHDDPNFNKPVKCDICDKTYMNKQTLKAHVRSIHLDVGKKYVCEECGAQFKGFSSLKTHKITHTGEFPYECTKCDRRFQSKANLFVHLDTHTETPYVCQVCNKPSTTLRGLRLHMVNHSDEKPHKCHMCGNAYKRVTALKKHLIVHSGIKPYSCNFCERTFADGSNKRIHMRRIHKKELAEMESAGMKVVPAVLPKIQQLRDDAVSVQG